MPWCPQCKNEFQEGYTLCSDCNVELVEDLATEIEYAPFFQAEQKSVADKLLKYFEYSALKSVIRYNQETENYILYVPDGQMKQAKKLYQAFYFVEREQHEKELMDQAIHKMEHEALNAENNEIPPTEIDDIHSTEIDDIHSTENETSPSTPSTEKSKIFKEGPAPYTDTWNKMEVRIEQPIVDSADSEEEDQEEQAPSNEASGVYVMKEDQYKDYASTVWIFLVMGIGGILFVVLNITGVLTYLHGIFPNITMMALFLFFIYVGITTQQRAKKIKGEIADENSLTVKINQWLKDHLTEDYLSTITDETLSDELNYIRMTEFLKEQLFTEFGSQNEAYLDQLIEDYYSTNFEV